MAITITDLIQAYDDYSGDKTEWIYLVKEYVDEHKKELAKFYLNTEIKTKRHEEIYLALKAKVKYNSKEIFYPTIESNKVFVVHGHNTVLLNQIQDIIKKSGFEPIILSQQPNGGDTIIEKLEKNIKDIFCAVIIHSGCDTVLNNGKQIKQSRPNVLFEHGLLHGTLGRNRLIMIKGDNEVLIPSDLEGIIYNVTPTLETDLEKELRNMKNK